MQVYVRHKKKGEKIERERGKWKIDRVGEGERE